MGYRTGAKSCAITVRSLPTCVRHRETRALVVQRFLAVRQCGQRDLESAPGTFAIGLPGQIQVSEAVYQEIHDQYELEHRGEVDIKGKGPMSTYLLRHKKPADSRPIDSTNTRATRTGTY